MNSWKYYNHALISALSPKEIPDESVLSDRKIWKSLGGNAMLARWTTNFDCQEKTEWWYCIKDDKFDITSLKSKVRYCVNRGVKNFDVKIIDPLKYKNEIFNVQIRAFAV